MEAERRLRELYEAHAPSVRAYALRRTDAATADDVTSEVFLVAWRRIDEVPAGRALPWLLGVARRVLANARRSAVRQQALRDKIGDTPAPEDVRAFDLQTQDRPVLAALAKLGDTDREALLLIGWDGLSVADAARVLDVRPGTLAVRLFRARRRFAEALGEHDVAVLRPSEVRS